MRVLKKGEVKITCTTCRAELAIVPGDVKAAGPRGERYAFVKCGCCGSETRDGIPKGMADGPIERLCADQAPDFG